MKQPSEAYINTVESMGQIYDFWNELYYGGELNKPVITVQLDRRERAYGWFVPREVWKSNPDDQGTVEINMSAQFLDRPLDKTATTMLHEMAHQYAYEHNIKDTSRRGYYHNKEFKRIAEAHGLEVENTGSYHGWCETTLSQKSKDAFKRFVLKHPLLYNTQHGANNQLSKNPSSTRKYVCPVCSTSVRATKEVYVICGVCNEQMIRDY